MNRREFLWAPLFGAVAAVAVVKGKVVVGDPYEYLARQRQIEVIMEEMTQRLEGYKPGDIIISDGKGK